MESKFLPILVAMYLPRLRNNIPSSGRDAICSHRSDQLIGGGISREHIRALSTHHGQCFALSVSTGAIRKPNGVKFVVVTTEEALHRDDFTIPASVSIRLLLEQVIPPPDAAPELSDQRTTFPKAFQS